MNFRSLTESLAFYMLIGFALGFIIGDFTGMSGPISMIALGLIMTLSMSEMTIEVGKTGSAIRNGLVPALMTFGILTPAFIIASFLFDGDLRLGWMLAAAMPAAVAIVPYSHRLNGDIRLALHGELAIYLIALVLTPGIALVLLNTSVNVLDLLSVLLLLILIPLGLSRLVVRMNLKEKTRNMSMNLIFLFFFLIVVGANRSIFFREPLSILFLVIISFILVFGIGTAVHMLLKRKGKTQRRTLTMFATIKNTGLAIAVALSLSRPEMAVPPTMLVIFEMIWVIYLSGWKFRD